MPDEDPTKPKKPPAGPGAHYLNLRNVKKLPPEEQRKVFDRIREAIDKELHPADKEQTEEQKEKPPE